MRRPVVLLSLGLMLGPCAALASEPENYIKYRKAMMKAIGGHMSASSQILRGKVSADGDLEMHAASLAALTARLPRLFPDGSDFGETQAKEEIWENWDKFEQAAAASRDATARFAEAAGSGDLAAARTAQKAVGKSCKGCHKDFRQKDE